MTSPVRRKLDRKIKEKIEEIQSLEISLTQAHAYLQGLMDAAKLMPADDDAVDEDAGVDVPLRPGTAPESAYTALKAHGRPLHIMDLLKAMGKDPTPENRASVGSGLATYVRKGQIFSRPAPNTYGLAEWGPPQSAGEPPDDFGLPLEKNEAGSA